MEEVRGAVGEWVEAFKGEGNGNGDSTEDGPFVKDVRVLSGYLGRVVREERDIAKAVDVARWLGWLVSDEVRDGGKEEGGTQGKVEGKQEDEDARVSWKKALKMVRAEVSAAVEERGLPPVEFA